LWSNYYAARVEAPIDEIFLTATYRSVLS